MSGGAAVVNIAGTLEDVGVISTPSEAVQFTSGTSGNITTIDTWEATTVQGSVVTVTPPSGQNVSLDMVASNSGIVPTGTIQSLVLGGSGTASVSGTVNVTDLEVNSGQLEVAGGTVNTDPVTVDAVGNISGFGTVTGAVTNIGTITASGGTLELTGRVSGAGTLIAETGATLLLDQGATPEVSTSTAGRRMRPVCWPLEERMTAVWSFYRPARSRRASPPWRRPRASTSARPPEPPGPARSQVPDRL